MIVSLQVRNHKLSVNGKQQDDSFILEQIQYEMKPTTVPAGQVGMAALTQTSPLTLHCICRLPVHGVSTWECISGG